MAKASDEEKSGSDEEKKVAIAAKVSFQAMESCMKMFAAYRRSSADEKALSDWMTAFGTLLAFLADKSFILDCKFFWVTHYEVLSELADHPQYAADLCKFKLMSRNLINDVSQAAAFQQTAIKDTIVKILQQEDVSENNLVSRLDARLWVLATEEASGVLDQGVVQEVKEFRRVLCVWPLECERDANDLEEIVGSLTKEETKHKLLGTLGRFDLAGKKLVERAGKELASFKAGAVALAQLGEYKANLKNILTADALELKDFENVDLWNTWAHDPTWSIGAAVMLDWALTVDKVAHVLAACAVGKWAVYFSVTANWGKTTSAEEDAIINMLRIASKLFSADGEPSQRLQVDACAFCMKWFQKNYVFKKASDGNGSEDMAREDMVCVLELGRFQAVNQWRDTLATEDSYSSSAVSMSSWSTVNVHLKTITDTLGFKGFSVALNVSAVSCSRLGPGARAAYFRALLAFCFGVLPVALPRRFPGGSETTSWTTLRAAGGRPGPFPDHVRQGAGAHTGVHVEAAGGRVQGLRSVPGRREGLGASGPSCFR